MKQRTISAVIFLIVMLGGLFGGIHTFFILFGFITAGSLWEFGRLVFKPEDPHFLYRKLSTTLIGILPFVVYGALNIGYVQLPGVNAGMLGVQLMITLFLFYFLLLLIELLMASETPFPNIANSIFALLYISLPFTLLISIANVGGHYAPLRVLGMLLLIWTNDTMAYIVGSQIGKHPFFARISPKKTWEGTLGGMVFTFVVAYILSRFILDFTLPQWMVLAAVVSVFGTLGDLVESMFKRSINVKDSGSILPGHGGFLDRFDSFIFVIPFTWFFLQLL